MMTDIIQIFKIDLFDTADTSEIKDHALAFNQSVQEIALDYLVAIPTLVILLPLLTLIAILIKLESPGPVFFKQERVGLNGKLFKMYKFRSMHNNADEKMHKDQIRAYFNRELDEAKGIKLKNDPRITKVGHVLRLYSLDELPQLLNVLKRDMSIVGPRPVPVYEADLYKLWQSERLNSLPGITGLWQVSGRSEVSFDEQLRLDIRYVRNQSLLLNLKIMLKTIPVVINRRGAG
jgi:lipopolysaccharide/colanic/teichoic acid biosynthesis glycosyltransferase